MEFEYVKKYYQVPATFGRRIICNGRAGIIVKDYGAHIGVNFDDDKPGVVSRVHPTWKMEYYDVDLKEFRARKQTKAKEKAKERYQRYLEFGDSFDSFIDFCYWDAARDKQ